MIIVIFVVCFFFFLLPQKYNILGIFQVKLRRQMVSVGMVANQSLAEALILMEAPPVVKSIESHFYLQNVE